MAISHGSTFVRSYAASVDHNNGCVHSCVLTLTVLDCNACKVDRLGLVYINKSSAAEGAWMGGAGDLTEVEQQLLMAAAVHKLGPATDLSRANTARVVNQVLRWRGLTAAQVNSGWRDEDCDSEHRAVYDALVRMTWKECRDDTFRPPERPGPALFEGGGNWGVPCVPDRQACWPHYNSCRLTAEGERVARSLLERHPAYRKSAEPGAAADGGA